MSWTFIPRYPTAGAWAGRPFKDKYNLKQAVQQLRQYSPNCEGQLVFTSDSVPKYEGLSDTIKEKMACMKKKMSQMESKFYVSYNHVAQLEEFMELLSWNEKKNLHKVVIYQLGYFIQ